MLTNCSALEPYRYINIGECSIPIPKTFKLREKKSQYESTYHEFNDGLDKSKIKASKFIMIRHKTPNYYSYWINEIKQSKEMKLASKTKRGNFVILEVDFDYDHSQNYHLIGEQVTLLLLNSSQKEVNSIIDYCEKTRR